MRHSLADDRLVDRGGLHLARADAGPADRRQRPREAPPVAVEHRQGPQVDGMMREVPADDVRERVEVRAAVVVDDALRVPGGARGVVEGDGAPFVVGTGPFEPRVPLFEERLVLDLADALPARCAGIIDVDDQWRALHPGERVRDHRRELAVGEQRLRLAVLQDERDGRRVEPDVDGVEHRAEHRYAEAGLVDRRNVRHEHRHAVPNPDTAPRERRGEAAAARVSLYPGEATLAVDDRGVVGPDRGGTLDERERGERRVVRRGAVEGGLEGVDATFQVHFRCSSRRPSASPRTGCKPVPRSSISPPRTHARRTAYGVPDAMTAAPKRATILRDSGRAAGVRLLP